MPSNTIQWFPGHMAKTRRLVTENLKNVDLILEVLDARIPYSSRNPEIIRLTSGKPSLILLNKAALADPGKTRLWVERFSGKSMACLPVDCMTGEGLNQILSSIQSILKEKQERYCARGMSGRRLRAMILGIPNVGKSTLINRLVGTNKAKTENRPGVTTDKAWFSTSIGIDLLDMPGLLWPKFDESAVGENLAMTGAIKDTILDSETVACLLCERLRHLYPTLLLSRYPIAQTPEELTEWSSYDILEAIGRKRGFLITGGEVNTERTAKMLLEEFRLAKIGRITLEVPRPLKKPIVEDTHADDDNC